MPSMGSHVRGTPTSTAVSVANLDFVKSARAATTLATTVARMTTMPMGPPSDGGSGSPARAGPGSRADLLGGFEDRLGDRVRLGDAHRVRGAGDFPHAAGARTFGHEAVQRD